MTMLTTTTAATTSVTAEPDPTPAPTPPPATLEDIANAEDSLLEDLLVSNESQVVIQEKGLTIVAQRLQVPQNSDTSGTSVAAIPVDVPGSSASVSFPVSMFDSLGEADVVAVVSAVDPGTSVAAGNVESKDESVTRELVSVLSISIKGADGSPVSVANLPEPIEFSLPNASDPGLLCAWLDETTGDWRTDGVYKRGFRPDGSLICATAHLTMFGAILEGFVATLTCSQVSMLSEESYTRMLRSRWYKGFCGMVLACLLGALFCMMAVAWTLDARDRWNGHWKLEYFLITEGPGDSWITKDSENKSWWWMCRVPGVSFGKFFMIHLLFTCLGQFWQLRIVAERLGEHIRGGGGPMTFMALGVFARCTLRSSSAICYINMQDAEFLLSDEAEELINRHQTKMAAIANTTAPDQHGAKTTLPTGQHCEGKAENGSGGAADLTLDTEKEKKEEPENWEDEAPEGSHVLFDEERGERLRVLRARLMECQQQHVARLSSRWCVLRLTMMSWVVHSPVPSLYSRSITISRSMRTLLFASDLLGHCMLCTIFLSSGGGALRKDSPSQCAETCNLLDMNISEKCIGRHIGRLIAIAVMSVACTRVVVMLMGMLHSRTFTRVDYVGSPSWHQQIRQWRRADMAIWLVGIGWCAFAVTFICLFFANVAEPDQAKWAISAVLGVVEEWIVIPAMVSCLVGLAMLIFLAGLSWRFGVNRSDFTRHGSLDSLRKLFSYTDERHEIQRVLIDQEDQAPGKQRWKNTEDDEDDGPWKDIVPGQRKLAWSVEVEKYIEDDGPWKDIVPGQRQLVWSKKQQMFIERDLPRKHIVPGQRQLERPTKEQKHKDIVQGQQQFARSMEAEDTDGDHDGQVDAFACFSMLDQAFQRSPCASSALDPKQATSPTTQGHDGVGQGATLCQSKEALVLEDVEPDVCEDAIAVACLLDQAFQRSPCASSALDPKPATSPTTRGL